MVLCLIHLCIADKSQHGALQLFSKIFRFFTSSLIFLSAPGLYIVPGVCSNQIVSLLYESCIGLDGEDISWQKKGEKIK